MHNGHRSRAFLGRVAPFAVHKTLEEQNTPCCCCFAFACRGRRRSWATSTLDLLSPSVVMAQTGWSKRWIKPEASLPSQLSGSPLFPLLFFPRKKKHKISFRISSGFYICVADQGVLVCRLPVLSFSVISLLPHFAWLFHLRCRTMSSCLSVVCRCGRFSVLNLLPYFLWFSICGGDQGVLVFRLPMRSFVGLIFHLRCRPRSSCLPSADAVVCWAGFPSAVQTKEFLFAVCWCVRSLAWIFSRVSSGFPSALETEEFLFLVCWWGHLSVLCCFFNLDKGVFFLLKESKMRFQLFVIWIFYARNLDCLFARFALVGDGRLESVAESGGVLFSF